MYAQITSLKQKSEMQELCNCFKNSFYHVDTVHNHLFNSLNCIILMKYINDIENVLSVTHQLFRI